MELSSSSLLHNILSPDNLPCDCYVATPVRPLTQQGSLTAAQVVLVDLCNLCVRSSECKHVMPCIYVR